MKNLFMSNMKTLFILILSATLAPVAVAGTITKNYTVKEFSKLRVSSAFRAEFIHSSENKVVIEIDETAAENVSVTNTGNELIIKMKDYTSNNSVHTMKAKIYGNSLSGIFISGASYFSSDYTLNEKELSIKVSGASNVKGLSLSASNLNIEVSGASKLSLKGNADKQIADVSGASFYNGEKCKSTNAFINASGASKAIVNCSDTLDAKASGASLITYTSTPKTIHKTASGASTIE